MDFDNPSPELKNKILEAVKKSGFPFEWEVRDIVKRALGNLSDDLYSFGVETHGDYLDHQENIRREFDLSTFVRSVASKDAPNLFWSQHFECKKSDKTSWIFFTEPKEDYYLKSNWTANSVNLRYLSIVPSLYSKNTEKLLGSSIHYGRLVNQSYSYMTSNNLNSEVSDNPIRSALHQVLKPMYAHFVKVSSNLIEQKKKLNNDIFLWLPVIVYSGNMFEYKYSSSGGELLPTKHVLLESYLTLGNNNFPSTYLVDVVRADYLPKYLEQQYSDYKLLKNFIVDKNPELRTLSEVVLYI
ncbi:MAG: hypothetical protein AABZ00_02410 [Chloroflexota bacterium]